MEMSIEEAIEIINHYLDYPKEEVSKALLVAIDTMRKYQKIVNDLKACEQDGMEFISVGFLKEIIDGNDD